MARKIIKLPSLSRVTPGSKATIEGLSPQVRGKRSLPIWT